MNNTLTTSLDFSALDRADIAPGTRRNYEAAIGDLYRSGIDLRIDSFDYAGLADWAATLPHSKRAALKAALSHMTEEYQNMLQAGVTVANLQETQVQLYRLRAMNNAIKVQAPKGRETPIWLSPAQVEEITSKPDRTTIQGRRDWIILATLFGAGLRREEMASLTFDMLRRQPMENGQPRGVLAILGKGKKKRTVPISPMLETHLREWQQEIGGGRVARGFIKGGALKDQLTPESINAIVAKYGAMIGVPDLTAHDTRRTYAQIGWDNTHNLIMIMTLLGHSSPDVTQKYLNLNVDINLTISDFIPLSGD
jgi:site-specific recombinase XerD